MSIALGIPTHIEPALAQLERGEEGFLFDAGLRKLRNLMLDV